MFDFLLYFSHLEIMRWYSTTLQRWFLFFFFKNTTKNLGFLTYWICFSALKISFSFWCTNFPYLTSGSLLKLALIPFNSTFDLAVSFLVFWYNKIFQAYLVHFLHQIWGWLFLQGVLVLLVRNCILMPQFAQVQDVHSSWVCVFSWVPWEIDWDRDLCGGNLLGDALRINTWKKGRKWRK